MAPFPTVIQRVTTSLVGIDTGAVEQYYYVRKGTSYHTQTETINRHQTHKAIMQAVSTSDKETDRQT
jgi:ureidoglycolate hydrolase